MPDARISHECYGSRTRDVWLQEPPTTLIPLSLWQVAIPLALRPGTEAFEEERDRLEEMRRQRGQSEEE